MPEDFRYKSLIETQAVRLTDRELLWLSGAGMSQRLRRVPLLRARAVTLRRRVAVMSWVVFAVTAFLALPLLVLPTLLNTTLMMAPLLIPGSIFGVLAVVFLVHNLLFPLHELHIEAEGLRPRRILMRGRPAKVEAWLRTLRDRIVTLQAEAASESAAEG